MPYSFFVNGKIMLYLRECEVVGQLGRRSAGMERGSDCGAKERKCEAADGAGVGLARILHCISISFIQNGTKGCETIPPY